MNDAPSQSQDKFIVRLPDGMRERIKAKADENGRSMNAEIVARLVASFVTESEGSPSNLIDRLALLETNLGKEFTRMREQLAHEQLLRGKVEDALLKERLKE